MAAHARLKNEFTEDEKYHNLISWLIRLLYIKVLAKVYFGPQLHQLSFREMGGLSGSYAAELQEGYLRMAWCQKLREGLEFRICLCTGKTSSDLKAAYQRILNIVDCDVKPRSARSGQTVSQSVLVLKKTIDTGACGVLFQPVSMMLFLFDFKNGSDCIFIALLEPVVSAVGPERHETGTKLILHALQQPKLNKQVMS